MLGLIGASDAVALTAFFAAVPATLSAVFAFKANRKVRTGNGQSAGRYMVQLASDLRDVKSRQRALQDSQEAMFTLMLEHTEQDNRNFGALHGEQKDVRKDVRGLRATLNRLERKHG